MRYNTVTVDKKAMHEVLSALVAEPRHIRELQATINTPLLGNMAENPIKILVDEFNNQPAPAWFHAECDDPDHSGFFENKADALARVSAHGGAVAPLYGAR